MAKRIDEDLVRKVAYLSRLELDEGQVREFTSQLSAILDYVAKMNELDTDKIEPLAHCLPVSNVFRQDRPGESLGTEKALANARRQDGKFFIVPKILDDSSVA